MELPITYFDPVDMVHTHLGNKVSRNCKVYGLQNIILNGKSILLRDCIVRGDLANVRIGKYCIIYSGTVIRPSYKHFSKGLTFFPVFIGDHVVIEEDCVIVSMNIGSYVHIGANSIISSSCSIKDCCQILPNSVVMPDTVIPPFSIVGGNPARRIGELPPSTVQLMIDATMSFYKNYLPQNQIAAAPATLTVDS